MKIFARARQAFAALLLLCTPAAAQPVIQANPALWHVRGARGDVYLLGAVHVLPPNVAWRTPAITQALGRADVFVFEVPEDAAAAAQVQSLIAARGYLPPDQSLRAGLRPSARGDFDAALAASGLPLATVDHERPWLAGLQMMFAEIGKLNFAADNGVDVSVMAQARAQHKEMRYLETIQQQFALLAPGDATLERDEFEYGLKDLRDPAAGIQPMIDAWAAGDQTRLDTLINGDLDKFPAARKALLDDRNTAWAPRIEAMLREPHSFFITVGAGHLTGPKGVPALLRAAGYPVEGPETGG